MLMFQPLKKYAVFSGRATRSEYWLFILLLMVSTNLLAMLDIRVGAVVSLALFIPGLAVSVRRLHDIGKSGFWYFIFLVPIVGVILLLVWFCTKGTDGDNDYGPDPLAKVEESDPDT